MPERTFLQRLIDVYTAPARAFAAVAESPRTWWQPLVVVALLTAAAIYLLIDSVILPAQLEELRRQVEDPEERAVAARWIRTVTWMAPAIVPLTIVVLGFIVHGIARLGLGGDGRVIQSLAVTTHAYLINIVGEIVRVSLMLLKGSPEVFLGPAALLPGDLEGTFVFRFLGQLDVFAAWKVVLVGIGLAIAHRLDMARVVRVLVVLWLLWAVLMAVLGGLGPGGGGA
jgi:hypothetical protein